MNKKLQTLGDVFRVLKRVDGLDTFDRVQAAYWWLTHNHDGQWSARYRALCQLGRIYRPGRLENGPDCETSQAGYDALCEADKE